MLAFHFLLIFQCMRHVVLPLKLQFLQNFVRQVSFNDVDVTWETCSKRVRGRPHSSHLKNLSGKYRRNQAEVFMPQSAENNGGQ